MHSRDTCMDGHTHRLKLKDDKTEYVYLVSSQSGGNIDVEPITIGESSIQPTPSARNRRNFLQFS